MVANRRPQLDKHVLVVWSYSLDNIIPTCRDFEEKSIKLVWNRRSTNVSLAAFNLSSSKATSDVNLTEKDNGQVDTKHVDHHSLDRTAPSHLRTEHCDVHSVRARRKADPQPASHQGLQEVQGAALPRPAQA